MGYALAIIFIVLLVIGLPIGLALGLGSLLSMGMFSPCRSRSSVQRLISGIRSFPLLAIPLYILAGVAHERERASRSASSTSPTRCWSAHPRRPRARDHPHHGDLRRHLGFAGRRHRRASGA